MAREASISRTVGSVKALVRLVVVDAEHAAECHFVIQSMDAGATYASLKLDVLRDLGILRGHTQSSTCEARWMKIWSTPHSDMGVTGTITVLR
jgi:hypothetical protein